MSGNENLPAGRPGTESVPSHTASRRTLPKLKAKYGPNGRAVQFEVSETERYRFASEMNALFGTEHGDVADMRCLDVIGALPRALIADDHGLNARTQDFLAFVSAVAPRNEVEAALGSQMYAVHTAVMQMAGKMNAAQNEAQALGYGSLMVKLSRTFAVQAEALTKLRTGGKQEIRVIHVQNIGDVNFNGMDGGGVPETGGQPHEPGALGVALAAGAPMWSAESSGRGLPGAGDAREEALPSSRREKSRRAQRSG